MAEFLLIHGSCHGAWCWRDVLGPLRAAGHGARAIDLPSHGDDPTPAEAVTLDLYADAILAALDGPAVLVGHSMAGFPVTLAAQRVPDRVAALVYLCAYVPVPGRSLADMRRDWPEQPLLPAIQRAPDGATMSFDPAMIGDVFYHDCPPGTVDFARARLTPQPIRPQETAIVDVARAEALPRHYIRCLHDRAIPPDFQAAMAAGFDPARVSTLPTSHSPFFAAPDMLAQRLISITEAL